MSSRSAVAILKRSRSGRLVGLQAEHLGGHEEMKGAAAAELAVDVEGQAKLLHQTIDDRQAEAAAARVARLAGLAALKGLED